MLGRLTQSNSVRCRRITELVVPVQNLLGTSEGRPDGRVVLVFIPDLVGQGGVEHVHRRDDFGEIWAAAREESRGIFEDLENE